MSAELKTFSSLAQRIAANDADIGISGMVLAPIAEALAKIGISASRPKALAILSQSSEAMSAGIEINKAIGTVLGNPIPLATDAAGEKTAANNDNHSSSELKQVA